MDSAASALPAPSIEELRAALQRSQRQPVQLVETHISWVLLGDAEAFKVKKPVRLPFLDFGSLENRRAACEEELRLDRAFAPELYRDVVAIRSLADGTLAFGGAAGEAVEYAVRMRRFAAGSTWAERLAAGSLMPRHVDAFAERMAAIHRAAPRPVAGTAVGTPAPRRATLQRLLAGIDAQQAASPRPAHAWPARAWPALRRWFEQEGARLERHALARLADGHVRECHGDLHLGNIVQEGDAAVPFDALEFDPALRWIDVLDDLAFTVMDLLANRRRDLALRLLVAYLDASGDHDGLPALRFFLVGRALVRAHVAAIDEADGRTRPGTRRSARYLRLAERLATHVDPRLAITHGLPGSGKTFASQSLLETAGAIRVRSDVERKRLLGVPALSATGDAGVAYGEALTIRTYDRLHDVARLALTAGWPVIVDAAFLREAERRRFAALARSLAVPFTILDCQAPMPVLRERIERRLATQRDASEADLRTLEHLATQAEPLRDDEQARAIVVDAGRPVPPATIAARWREAPPPSGPPQP